MEDRLCQKGCGLKKVVVAVLAVVVVIICIAIAIGFAGPTDTTTTHTDGITIAPISDKHSQNESDTNKSVRPTENHIANAATSDNQSDQESAAPTECIMDNCFGIFCVCPINADCNAPDVCATIYFYTETGDEIAKLQGTGDYKKGLNRTSIKDVASVQQVGTGCYRIYKGKKYNGASLTLEGNSRISLKEAHMDTTIKSVRYAINCEFPARGSVLGWVVGLAVAAVLLVAVVLFVFNRWKGGASAD